MTHVTSPRIIVAIDAETKAQARALVAQLDPKLCRIKIGSVLFTHNGPALIEEWHRLGFSVFLDLKFHDIPQTVAGACRSAAELGVWMVNLHVSAGEEALIAARTAVNQFPEKQRPLLIGVTVLTSLNESDLKNVGIHETIPTVVLKLAQLAQKNKLDGVVCSPQEIALLRQKMHKDFLLVAPGIRLNETSDDDQKRIATPKAAIASGADYLVIGRPIIQATNPGDMLRFIARETFS